MFTCIIIIVVSLWNTRYMQQIQKRSYKMYFKRRRHRRILGLRHLCPQCTSVISKIISTIVFYLFIKPKAVMDQFKEGLETAGVLKYLQKYTDLLTALFVDKRDPLTAGKKDPAMPACSLHA